MGKITINEDYLVGQLKFFSSCEDESSQRMHSFNWGNASADGRGAVPGNLAEELRIKSGGPAFTPGLDLKKGAENVRKNFFTRMTGFSEQCGFLNFGLTSLLDNSDRIESLNKVTAEDFEYYVEQTASGGGAGGGSGAGSGAGAGAGAGAGSGSGAA